MPVTEMTPCHELFMQRCLDLARQGEGQTRPNPMVGSVIVFNGQIIGEGFHRQAGSAHAEVNAIRSVREKRLLTKSTLYVNLEPCSHQGKTPPCSRLIIEKGIRRVVIGCEDTNPLVSGLGIKELKMAGVEVITGVLERESRELNRRFFTFHEKKRPYIILKWAESRDGFIDIDREITTDARPTWITNEHARRAVHSWRGREDAILVGSTTAVKDNPMLTARGWSGPNPSRLVIDRSNKLPVNLSIFNNEAKTLHFTCSNATRRGNAEMVIVPENANPLPIVLAELYHRGLQSVIVEGGTTLINEFLKHSLWDEARVFTGNCWFGSGVKSPKLNSIPVSHEKFGDSILEVYRNFL